MTEEDIKNITDKIVIGIKPKRVVLFGSMASGKTNENSDIDLCIIKDHIEDRMKDSVAIRKVIGSNLIPLDIVVLGMDEFNRRKDIWGTVQYEIDKKGKVLYERRD